MQGIAGVHGYIWSEAPAAGHNAPSRESIQFLKYVGAWAEPADTRSAVSALSPLPTTHTQSANGLAEQPRPFAAIFADALANA